MSFAGIGRIVAIVMIVLGLLMVVQGFVVAYVFDADPAAVRRYIGSGTTGETIDRGLLTIFAGLILGLLAAIARKKATNNAEDASK